MTELLGMRKRRLRSCVATSSLNTSKKESVKVLAILNRSAIRDTQGLELTDN